MPQGWAFGDRELNPLVLQMGKLRPHLERYLTLHGRTAKLVTKLRLEPRSVHPGTISSGFTSGPGGLQLSLLAHLHHVGIDSEDHKSCLIQLGVPIAQPGTWDIIDPNRHLLNGRAIEESYRGVVANKHRHEKNLGPIPPLS